MADVKVNLSFDSNSEWIGEISIVALKGEMKECPVGAEHSEEFSEEAEKFFRTFAEKTKHQNLLEMNSSYSPVHQTEFSPLYTET